VSDILPRILVGGFIVSLFVAQQVRLWWRRNEWKRRRRSDGG